MNKNIRERAALSAAPERRERDGLLRRLRRPRRLRTPSAPDEREERRGQRRAAGRIAAFFVLMLALTLFARGMAAAAATEVEVTTPQRAQVTEETVFSGTLESQTTETLTLPEGLTVRSVYVSAGQAVEEGEALLAVDTDALNSALTRAQGELDRLNLQLAGYQEPEEADDSALTSAETGLARAREDAQSAAADQSRALSRAEEALADARTQRDQAQADLAALEASRDALRQTLEDQYAARDELQSQLDAAPEPPDSEAPDAQDPERGAADGGVQEQLDALNAQIAKDEAALETLEGQIEAARDAVQSAQDTVDAAADSLEDARSAAQDTRRSNQRSVEDAEDALTQAQEDYAGAQADAETQNLQNQTEAELLAVTIAEQEALVRQLEELQAADGVLAAPVDGTVRALEGTEDGGAVSVTFTVRSDGYLLTLTGDELQELTVGDALTVSQGEEQTGQTALATLTQSEEGEWAATARLTGGGWTDGSAEARIVSSSETYDLTVPAAACHTDNGGSFVYVAELRESVLGMRYVVRREPVNLLASDGATAAVDGILSGESLVICGATRSVQEGETVRVASS